MTILTLTTGCAFIMWLGEQISERGVGNGISLIIFAGIVVGLPRALVDTVGKIRSNELSLIAVIILVAFMVAVVGFIVYMERAQRRIPVQYAKRMVGRKVYGGQSTYLPLRVNTAGVIPVIFASSLMALPATVSQMSQGTPWLQKIADVLAWGQPLHYLLYVIGIIFFSYFYISIIFNPVDLAENMRKYGSFIPGIRSGKRTAEYIDRVLTRISLVGASYLALVSILPDFLLNGVRIQNLPWVGPVIDPYLPQWVTQGMGINFYFGGTSQLIVVGVAMDTLQQIESQLVMRNYDGFLKRGRIRGRRG
jgi:preprotein translocase subunit SecY